MKYDQYEKLEHTVEMPITFTKKDNLTLLSLAGRDLVLPKSVADSIEFNGRDSLTGEMSAECTFYIKLNKSKKYEVVKGDNDYEMLVGKMVWKADNKEIPDFSSESEFYTLNGGDPLNPSLHQELEKKLQAGDLEHLIHRNDGKPWSLAEAKVVLEIYLKTKDSEYGDQMDMIKAYINEGRLNRSFHSVRMMVHGMCFFDEDHQNDGFSNMGKIFKQVWDENQDEILTKIKTEKP